MFYIDNNTEKRRKNITLSHILPSAIVFVALMAVTSFSTINSNRSLQEYKSTVTNDQIAQIRLSFTNRLTNYEDVLRASKGLIETNPATTAAEWSSFVKSLDIQTRYDGLQSVGYAELVNSQDKEKFAKSMQGEGFKDFQIYPEGNREKYIVIKYIKPYNDTNKSAQGFDMYSEASRRIAMDDSALNNTPSVSGVVTLISDKGKANNQPGLLIYVPIYVPGIDIKNLNNTERTKYLRGFSFTTFRSYNLLDSLITKGYDDLGFQLLIEEENSNTLIYQNSGYQNLSNSKDKPTINDFVHYNKKFQIKAYLNTETLPKSERSRPKMIFWTGISFSFIISILLLLYITLRTNKLLRLEDLEIQKSKDELIALASHQLRTPATGVKQYLMMIKDGYFGDLTSEQIKYLDKAIASNDRQIATINEMLVVARTDAGNFKLSLSRFDFVKMLNDLIDDHDSSIREKNQKLIRNFKLKKLNVTMDRMYIQMAIENIISNASKYTHQNGEIKVSLSTYADQLTLKIKDTGVGVAKNDHKLLFKKFIRIPNDLTNKSSGSGIGLYLSRQIIEAHQGHILFDSSTDKGSEFTIVLPINYHGSNGSSQNNK